MDILGFEKILFHSDKLEKLKNGISQFPVNGTISLSNYCNHKCLWCSVYAAQEKDVKSANLVQLTSFLARAYEQGLKSITYIGNGEPTAHPKFGDLVGQVADIGLKQGMFTNGYLLDRCMDQVLDNFTFVRVSLDAGSAATHEQMHDVKNHYNKILDNIRTLRSKRDGAFPTIGIQFAVHHLNIKDLRPSVLASKELGVDYFSIKPVFNRGSVGLRIPKNQLTEADLSPLAMEIQQEFSSPGFTVYYRPHQIGNEVADENLLEYRHCVAGFFNLQIYEDGRVMTCGPGQISVGTVNDDVGEIQERIFQGYQKLDLTNCPAGCRYHALNHLVDAVVQSDQAQKFHVDFI